EHRAGQAGAPEVHVAPAERVDPVPRLHGARRERGRRPSEGQRREQHRPMLSLHVDPPQLPRSKNRARSAPCAAASRRSCTAYERPPSTEPPRTAANARFEPSTTSDPESPATLTRAAGSDPEQGERTTRSVKSAAVPSGSVKLTGDDEIWRTR